MPRFVSVGECFVNLFGDDANGYRLSHAGFASEMAQLTRQNLGADWSVDLFTALGEDVHSRRIVDALAASGVGIGHILKVPGRSVGLSLVDGHGEAGPIETDWRAQAAARFMADDTGALAAAFDKVQLIYVTGSAFAILPPRGRGRLLKALHAARRNGSRIVLAPHESPGLWTSRRVEGSTFNVAATVADAVFTDVPAERTLYGDETAEMAAARYREWGVEEVMVRRLSPSGIFLSTSAGGRWYELNDSARRDMRGAAYLAARARGLPPEEAIATIAVGSVSA